MDWGTYYNFPVSYKRWLIKRIEKEIKDSQNSDTPTKAPHHNTSDVRGLLGKIKQHTPNSKMHRF